MLAKFGTVGFGSTGRRRSGSLDQASGRDLSEAQRRLLPAGFEAVGEALASGSSPAPACAVVGRALARDGASLGEALEGLSLTYTRVLRREPEFAPMQAISLAWSESTLEYLHQISCEDPLTGLASLSHVRTRLDEIYREAENTGAEVRTGHAVVVVQLVSTAGTDPFVRALTMAQVADALRSVFSGGETIGRARTDRALALVRRDSSLGRSTGVLRRYLADFGLGSRQVRVWIEGLPPTAESAARLLDDLAR